MTKTRKWILGLAGVLLLAGIAYLFRSNTKRYNWYESYQLESKEPYGAFVIGELLKSYFPGKAFTVSKKPLKDLLAKRKSGEYANYIFMGAQFPSDTSLINTVLDFVNEGNTAFIAAGSCPTEILEQIFPDTCAEEYLYYAQAQDTFVNVRLYSESFHSGKTTRLNYVFRNIPYSYSWSYIDSTFFCQENPDQDVLGSMNNGQFNYLHARYGNGDFYLYTTPLAFSNYQLKNPTNLEYASQVFSYLKPGEIIWDEYNQLESNLNFNSDLRLSQSPLGYILSQDSLRWAWYLTLAFTILYMLFFGKRRQRIIPLQEVNKNTSLEYVRTVGQLYYQEKNHRVICVHKMKLFQAFIRNKYFINTYDVDDHVIERISRKSEVNTEEIRNIFSQYNWIDKNLEINDETLISFHQKIEHFYKTCK